MQQASPVFSSAVDFENYLDSLGLFHMDLGLGRIETCLKGLGLQQPDFLVAQVVGTNGKGATAAYLATLAAAHGLRTGLFTSPHFVHPRERIRILAPGQDRMVSEADWLEAANACVAHSGTEGAQRLTYFELLTAMATRVFARAKVDLAVFEAGLGGTYDATNALKQDLLVLTRIGLDHENVLGPTIEAIAADKAGAMRDQGRVVSAPQRPAVENVLRKNADVRRVSLTFLPKPETPSHNYLDSSFALACATWETLSPLGRHACHAGLFAQARASTRLSGRLQQVPASHTYPNLLLDGAHNADGLEALRRYLHTQLEPPKAIIFTSMQDRPIERLAPLVNTLADCPILVPQLPGNPRAWDAPELALHLGPNASPCEDLNDALNTAQYCCGPARNGGLCVICGSLYLLGAFFSLYPELLDLTP